MVINQISKDWKRTKRVASSTARSFWWGFVFPPKGRMKKHASQISHPSRFNPPFYLHTNPSKIVIQNRI
ncbi:hypothetical protein L2E82_51371 [Cichorium intybus]|nr:hypothetical protein L2E82_51371 [Cichorium intybus]